MKKAQKQAITIASSSGGGTASQARQYLYEHEPCIEFGGEMLTVNSANALFQAYFAESSEKADELKALIIQAKNTIREANPDE